MADPRIDLVAKQYQVSEQMVAKALEGLTREELLRAPEDGPNPLIWLFGHIASVRYGVLAMLGESLERPWPEIFGKGVQVGPHTQYPATEAIQAVWDDVSARLAKRFESVTAEELAADPPRQFRIEDSTLAGAVAYLGYHEAYHVGQMAQMRKWLGKGSMVG